MPLPLPEMVVIAGEHAKNTKIGSLKKCENFFFFSANLQCQTCREDKKFFEIKLKKFFLGTPKNANTRQ
jgi:hypothetical protein